MDADNQLSPELLQRMERRQQLKRKRRRRKAIGLILTCLLILVALWKLTSELSDKVRSKKELDTMAAMAVQENTTIETAPEEETQEPRQIEVAPIQVDFQELWLYYPDIAGWLYCPGTSLNYPVVQTDNNQYYVHRLPDGRESAGGSLFVDCTNTWGYEDANTVIYGHDMKDGTMFGYLHNFDNQTYYENHPVIYLLSPGCNYRMDIICTAVVSIDSAPYLKKMDADELQSWLDELERISLIRPMQPINREAEHFLTLSTCSYEFEDARFVVIGSLKQIY